MLNIHAENQRRLYSQFGQRLDVLFRPKADSFEQEINPNEKAPDKQ